MRPKEIPICGWAAVQAVFEQKPETIKRLFFDYPTSRRASKLASYLAKNRRIYRVVTPEELSKVADTVHHGGIVAIVEVESLPSVSDADIASWAAARSPLLVLDRIGNAHNLGAIARTAAFLGVSNLILPDHPQQALPSEAAHRVAEGGMAHIKCWQVANLAAFCGALAQKYSVLGAAVSHGARPLHKWMAEHAREAQSRPIALVLGNEENGISKDVADVCTALVWIPGHSERVESLNVSVAAAIFMWELWGRNARRQV
jgi:RNA methyltransferase, TrmH family